MVERDRVYFLLAVSIRFFFSLIIWRGFSFCRTIHTTRQHTTRYYSLYRYFLLSMRVISWDLFYYYLGGMD
ncbi:uncharacterized protein BO95DRAFT_125258 [Aspergillus brunneoviolaceus CBS 621.78]|uniref:Uncharacterized protein n=1 Tax=Aspergillus brunneoviolaceus CBS 621.78 TaxID=1450534 RepID=A0ACD1GAG8_9EURO|nr:hypothetical protein BO95DRAFT_125258 [Aspergillus brunneoviolaceus CBS 621.78]RAH46129.1 hypothetical protein BO95DRAFT_125258 [Aspergillus brunneoviolaceus CBS 621.78]